MQSVMILSLPASPEPMIELDQPRAPMIVLVKSDKAANLLPVVQAFVVVIHHRQTFLSSGDIFCVCVDDVAG